MNSVTGARGSSETAPQAADDDSGDATASGNTNGNVASGNSAQAKATSEQAVETEITTTTTTKTPAAAAAVGVHHRGCPGNSRGGECGFCLFEEVVVEASPPSSSYLFPQNASASPGVDSLQQCRPLDSFLDTACGKASGHLSSSTRICPSETDSTATFVNGVVQSDRNLKESRRIWATSFPSSEFFSAAETEKALQHQMQHETAASFPLSDKPAPERRQALPLLQVPAQDTNADSVIKKQNIAALICVLERQKFALQRQLKEIRKELSAQNIFSLVRASNASQLQYLLENKICDVNKRDYNGCTPLHVAALEGNEVIVRVLISFGADLMAVDNTGRTPLDWAAANRHSSVCHYLMNVIQRLMLTQEQKKPQIQRNNDAESVESTEKNVQRNTSFGVSSTNNSMMQSTHLTSALRESTCSLPTPSLPLDSEIGNEQQNEHGLLSSFLTCLPPDMISLMRSRSALSANPIEAPLHEDESEFEEQGTLSNFSSYTTISGTVPLVVCMVGLPGRGKSFIAQRISRYLNWKGVPCRVFNAGNYRRRLLGVEGTSDAGFYDPNNANGKQMREKMAEFACEDLVEFISRHRIAVGVFDATNTTKARREHLVEFFNKAFKQRHMESRVMFIESICNDDTIITENILRAKCDNDDFKNVGDTSKVIASFRSRISEYEKVYEPLDRADDLSFIRIIDVKRHVVMKNIPCGLASSIAFFLMNLHPVAHPIYISLPGETEGEKNHMYGGDEHLTPLGNKFALALKRFILERHFPHMIVLHGTNHSVLNTLKPLAQSLQEDSGDGADKVEEEENSAFSGITCQEELLCPLPGLDSINYGLFSGRTVQWVRKRYAKLSRLLYVASPVCGDESALNLYNSKKLYAVDVDDKKKGIIETHEYPKKQDQGEKDARKQHFDKSARATSRFLHVPNGTDPRLSYCVQFPNGESCRQVNVRLEPALMAVMRVQGPVFVVATSVPAQGVLAFFTDTMPEVSPTLRLPQHAVVEIGVKGEITVHQLVEPVDHVPQPGSIREGR
ncbi:6-phosphofructo-2-kinase 1 [Trypanosoma cruzi]|uniref:6-phosphofructo-2-kinase/fructose-2, 6-biphosphatase, putative n=2 Tax=Trypanosoma cruzi TaxID=5693 RepID=Q4E602_TRYCC|nr:6-phosphofructo-2-kinase/fructose-2,6-biphosphatase, putative [Trypanosoma cruzi]EAO00287.1 6-phosphofructo-2-kinase/fructose-2,6-biphosphatase, putative [Trypanosoma cruzi]PWV18210.1 6-phosphofructo-2-kinase 1 [Trypanosoma cruzi]|eukprot:XP_822138.1 6-phosphofructo-2-kinase/fructose-2,6-biphosphatase [Trypanosoma cruzi strain CL Brener]